MEEKIYHDIRFDEKIHSLKVRLDDRGGYVQFMVILPGKYDLGEVAATGIRFSCPYGEVEVNGIILKAQPTQHAHLVRSGESIKISADRLAVLTCLFFQR